MVKVAVLVKVVPFSVISGALTHVFVGGSDLAGLLARGGVVV